MMSTTSKTSYKSKSPNKRFFTSTTLKNTAKKPLFNSKRPSPIAVPTLKRSTTLNNIGDDFGGGSRTALMKGKTQEMDFSYMGDGESPLNKSNNAKKKNPSSEMSISLGRKSSSSKESEIGERPTLVKKKEFGGVNKVKMVRMSTFAARNTFSMRKMKRSNTNNDLSSIINQMEKLDKEDSLLRNSQESQTPDIPSSPNYQEEEDSKAIDITKSFYFGDNSPRRKFPQAEEQFPDDKSLEEFQFPPQNNAISRLKKQSFSPSHRASIGTRSPESGGSSPRRSSHISGINNMRNSPSLLRGGLGGLDSLIDQLDEEDELDFMIDVSYILIYVSETLAQKILRINTLMEEFEMKHMDYINLD